MGVSREPAGCGPRRRLWLALAVSQREGWEAAWVLGALLVSAVALVCLVGLNLVYALVQVILATDDCRLSQALRVMPSPG